MKIMKCFYKYLVDNLLINNVVTYKIITNWSIPFLLQTMGFLIGFVLLWLLEIFFKFSPFIQYIEVISLEEL